MTQQSEDNNTFLTVQLIEEHPCPFCKGQGETAIDRAYNNRCTVSMGTQPDRSLISTTIQHWCGVDVNQGRIYIEVRGRNDKVAFERWKTRNP